MKALAVPLNGVRQGYANPLSLQLFNLQRNLGRGSSGTAELVQRKSDNALLVIKVIQVISAAELCW